VAPVATAKRTGNTNVRNEADQSSRPTKRQKMSFYHDPSPEPDQDEKGNGTDSSSDDEHNSAESNEGSPHPAMRQWALPSCDGPTPRKPKHYLQQRSDGRSRPRRKPRRDARKPHSPIAKESGVAVGYTCLQSDLSGSSLPGTQHPGPMRRDGDQGTSLDGNLAGTARTTPAVSESAPPSEPPPAA
jgi:hypothetical protein